MPEVSHHDDLIRAPGAPMPVVFVGHGSPMNVVEDNRWSRGFRDLATLLPRPRAILAISAHWYVDGTFLTDNAQPRTIYDFSGFPQALYEVEYNAPGSVDLATRVRSMIGDARASLRGDWGLDHGTWSVLHWMYPAADIPVVQLSMDRRLDARGHYELGRSLAALRHEGVLILASGNVVHNLRDAFQRMQSGNTSTPDWAARFDQNVASALVQRDTEGLLRLYGGDSSRDGALAHPYPDHWWPLIYAYAATEGSDVARFPLEGFDLGSLSMRNVVFG